MAQKNQCFYGEKLDMISISASKLFRQLFPAGPKSVARLFVILILLGWYSFFLIRPVTLIRADIGRHIKNGEVLLSTPVNQWSGILKTNFYSYTNRDFPFINHHWASGIIFFPIWKISGFVGLSIFSIIINCITLLMFFKAAKRQGGFGIAALTTLFLIPLVAERSEIRPEMFSYLFSAIFYWLLSEHREERLNKKWLLLLIPLQTLWINLHIYFFLGVGLVGAFWLEAMFAPERPQKNFRWLSLILGGVMLATLLNPSGLRGVLYPLQIFQNYAVPVQENESVRQFAKEQPGNANVLIYKITVLTLFAGWVILWFKNKRGLSVNQIVLGIFFAAIAYRAVRNFSIFALFAIPLLSSTLGQILVKNKTQKKYTWIIAGIIVAIATLLISRGRLNELKSSRGLGLSRGASGAAEFILNNKIEGPLFNDFDDGSYAIFYLFPKLPPFTDNRPEAFPADFFNQTYVPLHTDDGVWRQALAKYGFNTILYAFDDKAPFALPFIVQRILDPDWAPVYADKFNIIFLKRAAKNAEVIKKHEIPKEEFSLQEEK